MREVNSRPASENRQYHERRRRDGRIHTGADEEPSHTARKTARKAENTDNKRDRRTDGIAPFLQPPIKSLLVKLRLVVPIRLELVSLRECLFPPEGSDRDDAAGRVTEGREERRAGRRDLFSGGEGGADVEVCDEEEDEEDEGGGDEEDGKDGGDDDCGIEC
jgi:hypothetical protein